LFDFIFITALHGMQMQWNADAV